MPYVEPKIDQIRMIQLLHEGYNDTQIAKEFSVTRSAVTQMRYRMKKRMEYLPDLSRSELSAENIDTMKQLQNINRVILEELRRCRSLVDKETEKQTEVEKLEKQVKANPGNTDLVEKLKKKEGVSFAGILKIQANIIAISAEVRKQLEFQIKIAEVLYDVTMVAEFQEEILKIIGLQSAEVKMAIIKALKERRTLRGLIKLEK